MKYVFFQLILPRNLSLDTGDNISCALRNTGLCMARFLAQLILAGTQVVGRAFARALKQEIEASQEAARRLGNTKTRAERVANNKTGISLDEAKQILHVGELDKEEITKRYEALFKANERTNGGSFYIQSKVVRAKERLDLELQQPQVAKGEKT